MRRNPKKLFRSALALGVGGLSGLFALAVLAGNNYSCGSFLVAAALGYLAWNRFRAARKHFRESSPLICEGGIWIDYSEVREAPPVREFGNIPPDTLSQKTSDDHLFERIIRKLGE